MRSDEESKSSDRETLLTLFQGAVAMLAEGGLTFPAPFDLASSAALAQNIDDDDLAEKLFEVTARRECGFQVAITEIEPGGKLARTVVDTTVASRRLLFALLDGLMDELQENDDE